jgi:hypothetical protein
MIYKATMPTTHFTERMSPSEFAIRGKAALRDRKVCDICNAGGRLEPKELDGRVRLLCGECDRCRRQLQARSTERSPEQQARIDRRTGLMKMRLRIAMLGAF